MSVATVKRCMSRMNAIVLTKYATPDALELREVERPVPTGDEVLIKVHAAAVNDWDLALVYGKPLFLRAIVGLLKPKNPIIGCEVAGQIVAVGDNVRHRTPGEDVYGDLSESGFGGYAEYVCVGEQAVAPKPRNLTYEKAVAIPHAALLAQQALGGIAGLTTGQNLLINGAGGGVGALGVQLAKRRGVSTVTGVDSTEKQDFLRSIGFDQVIDYTQEDFTAAGQSYDVILDAKTNRSPFAYARVLKPDGTYVSVGGSMPRLLQCLVCGPWIARTRRRQIRILALKPNTGLGDMTELAEAGHLVPSIDRIYALDAVPHAINRFKDARHLGKIVVRIGEPRPTH